MYQNVDSSHLDGTRKLIPTNNNNGEIKTKNSQELGYLSNNIHKKEKEYLNYNENYDDSGEITSCFPKVIDFNYILEELGGFGKQQKILFSIQCVVSTFYAFILFGQMFLSLAPPDHWCDLPIHQKDFLKTQILAHEGPLDPSQMTARIKELTIPKEMGSEDMYEKCLMYDVNWSQMSDYQSISHSNSSWSTLACSNGWAYNFSLYYPTVTSEFNWVCDQSYKIPFSQAVFFMGSLIGGPLFGWLADSRGRRFGLISSNFLSGISGIAASISPNFTMYCVSLFILGFNAYPQLNIIYILMMEFVTPRHRSLVAIVPFLVFLTLGFTILPWIAYFIANWRILGAVLYGPLLLMPCLWKVIPESVRWQLGKGKKSEAIKTLETLAVVNGVKQKEKLKYAIKIFVDGSTPEVNVSVLHLFKTPRLRKHFIALCFLLISIRVLYDAHVRVAQTINYNLFITFSVSSAIEVFSGIGAYLLADSLGRKYTTITFFFLSAIIEIVRTLITDDYVYTQLALHSVGKITITLVINVAFMFPVEILPTVARSQATGVIHTLGFLFAFASPYIVYLAENCRQCALMLLSFVALFGGLVVLLLLPETRNKDLPDTLEEGEEFCRDQDLCRTKSNDEVHNSV